MAKRPPYVTKLKYMEMQAAASWLPVTSSNVRAICWRPGEGGDEKRGLGVWFAPKNSKGQPSGQQTVYFYPDADYEVYVSMRNAPSKGKFVHQVLKQKYSVIGPYPPGA